MSAGDTSSDRGAPLSPVVEAAARGELPAWAEASPRRRAHIARVVALLDEWAAALALPETERRRWRAAGWLHDALRDAPPERLAAELAPHFANFPPPLLHGPAVAHRLRGEVDAELADAVRYHTIGHPDFGLLGRALYLADFLDPGRDFARDWRAELRARMPRELDRVLVEVIAARLRHLLEERRPIRPETAAFWSALAGEEVGE